MAAVVTAGTLHVADPLVLALSVVSVVTGVLGVLIFVCAAIAQELLHGYAADTAPSHRVLDYAEKLVARGVGRGGHRRPLLTVVGLPGQPVGRPSCLPGHRMRW